MKLKCKCGVILTKDICYTNKSKTISTEGTWYNISRIHAPGFFRRYRKQGAVNNKWHTEKPAQIIPKVPATYSVAYSDVILEIPPMVRGWGCCNWSHGHQLKCSCGEGIAEMYLDCYEVNCVEFYLHKVIEVYN